MPLRRTRPSDPVAPQHELTETHLVLLLQDVRLEVNTALYQLEALNFDGPPPFYATSLLKDLAGRLANIERIWSEQSTVATGVDTPQIQPQVELPQPDETGDSDSQNRYSESTRGSLHHGELLDEVHRLVIEFVTALADGDRLRVLSSGTALRPLIGATVESTSDALTQEGAFSVSNSNASRPETAREGYL